MTLREILTAKIGAAANFKDGSTIKLTCPVYAILLIIAAVAIYL
jgi:hypothetical protein